MPPAFVLSQDQTLKFIPDLLPQRINPIEDQSHRGRPKIRASKRSQSMREHQAAPRPPPAHPFPLLHNLKQQSPQSSDRQRGRAYKPIITPRQHPIGKADKKMTLLSPASHCLGTIIEGYGVLGFGKKQPALDDDAEGSAEDGKTRRDDSKHAANQQCEQRQEGRQRETGEPHDAAQPDTVPARDRKTHFLQQIIL